MSKKEKKDKGDKKKAKQAELPPIPKYQNENMIETLGGKFKKSEEEIDRLKNKLTNHHEDTNTKNKKYIQTTKDITQKLERVEISNAFLTNEITEIKKNRDDFEADCKRKFDEQFKAIKEEEEQIIEKANNDIENMKGELKEQEKEMEELRKRCKYLKTENERLNTVQRLTVESYEEKIKKINQEHRLKIQLTTEIFENFLKNNQELLTTDLYTVYRNLKKKFDIKIRECLDFKEKNEDLIEQNKNFRISIDNDDDMLNECAKIQVEHKKRNKQLNIELAEKNKLIKKIKEEYQKQVDEINEKFKLLNKDYEDRVQELQNALIIKNKELEELRNRAQLAISQRSELEIFFIDMLRDVKKEIQEKRKMERNSNRLFPHLNSSMSSSCSTSGKDDSTFVTSVKRVDVKDLDPESKEKLLRGLLNKINENNQNKKFSRLRDSMY